ncbi:flavin reductase family protein [Pedobacter cryoconitis]|uniref:Flavin reductase (DIM6/NTAB) family NADH-FMN oxidoreductase RutF n=1 Tax=Pedobacter cryoconitis TaxID=188932 RepID=A0A7X0J3D8_9SPHI|nr:flavin reductase family protein [Pedobacter cryoconitis]MBB6498896.1 flavin reductase (DIM6/NTAB) family NADH-FMN oxidoreductase RutF [Pedobacter cryoconitis]
MHKFSEPEILYFGTPVVLISSINEDYTYNLAPISSVFWLGWRCVIGIAAGAQTARNLIRTKECVLNLPSVNEVNAVNRLALTTGAYPVPEGKIQKGYRFERDKFATAGMTAIKSEIVLPPRVKECPVQLEAKVEAIHSLAESDPHQKGRILTIELSIQRVYVEESILLDNKPNRIDPDKWRPLIMSFQHFYGLGQKIGQSNLAKIPEFMYHSSDLDQVRMMNKQ